MVMQLVTRCVSETTPILNDPAKSSGLVVVVVFVLALVFVGKLFYKLYSN